MNAASTAVVRRHVAHCCGWMRATEEFGTVKVRQAHTTDDRCGCRALATFAIDTPKLAAADEGGGVT
jgi:hypothetical protein